MQELILYIKPKVISGNQNIQQFTRVDLMDAELITLTQVIQDVKEIDKIFTDFSRTFNLPASKNNNRIFKHWYNDDVIGFDNTIMSDAIIELNHLPFKEGEIKLEEVVIKNNKPSIYKVTFFGKTVSLNNLIGDDQLEDLNWLSNFDFTPNNTNILNGFQNGIDVPVDSVTYTDAIIYPLLTHTQQYIYNSTGDFDNFGNIAYAASGTNFNSRGVFPEDLKPAIKVSLILKAIEQKYGLTFKSGEFFDSSVFTNMYLWLHREKGRIIEIKSVDIKNQTNTCSLGLQSSFNIESNSCGWYSRQSGIQNNTLTEFTGGTYKITGQLNADGNTPEWEFRAELTPTDNTIPYTLEIIDILTNNVISKKENVTGTQVVFRNIFTNSFYPPLIDGGFFINNGESIELAVRVKSEDVLSFNIVTFAKSFWTNFDVGSHTSTSQTIYFSTRYTYSQITLSTGVLRIQEQTPKINVLSFLKSLFKMHNLTAFVDTNNEIVVKTLDNFYSGDTIDISKFVVTDQHTIGATLPFTEIDFKYTEPKSILAEQFENKNNIRFGQLQFFSEVKTGNKFDINIDFEHMIFERLNDLSNNSQTEVQYGLFTDDELKPSIGAPLLFYGVYKQNISDSINFIETTRPESGTPATGTQHEVDDYWMPSNYNESGTSSTPPDFNLNFGSEINEFTLTDYGGNNNSLFQLYYENYILRILNKKTRLYKVKAILPLKELLKISLDDTIIIGTREFTINKMTTKLQSGETQLELLSKV